jgi:hypothetical protein
MWMEEALMWEGRTCFFSAAADMADMIEDGMCTLSVPVAMPASVRPMGAAGTVVAGTGNPHNLKK